MPAAALSRRDVLLAAAGGLVLPPLLFWPLLRELGSAVPKDVGDPLPQAWQLAWGGHALRSQPLDLFQSNQFFPGRNTLAYSDSLLGYAPAGLLGSGPGDAVLRYDVLFLLAPALAFAATFLLARQLGLGRSGAAVAGVAFGFSPYRLEQFNHLHVLSSGGIPLALLLLLRGHGRGDPRTVFAGWAVTAWQLTLGFSLGLLLVYLIGGIWLWLLVEWLRDGRPALTRSTLTGHVAGLSLLAGTAFLVAQPYLAVVEEFPEARRTLADTARFSGPLVWSYLSAAEESTLWGPLTSGARQHLTFASEQTLFPGLTVVLLGLSGLLWRRAPLDRRLRVFLAVAVTACAAFALGTAAEGARSFSPYRLLYELAPGFQAVRVPGRITTLTTLGLSVLAGCGAQRWAGAVAARWPRLAPWAAAGLVGLVLFEGSSLRTQDEDPGSFRTPIVEAPPVSFADVKGPALHLPAEPEDNRRYLLWSTDGFEDMANGRSSLVPQRFLDLVEGAATFPDRESVARVRAFGLCTVALHRAHLAGTPWQAWQDRSIQGLGIRRTVWEDLVVYDLNTPGGACR